MRCAILAVGTRGDVEPLIALGDGLAAAGVDVRFATHADFEPIVRAHGFEFRRMTGSPARFYDGAGGNAMQQRLRDAGAFRRFFDNYLSMFFGRLLEESWDAAQGADVVLAWNGCAAGLAERLDVPVWLAFPFPPIHLTTAAYRNPYQPSNGVHGGPLANLLSWESARPVQTMGSAQINQWRRDVLGLGALDENELVRRMRLVPHVLGFSRAIIPPPWDWPPSVHVTGTWFLEPPDGYEPPADLAAFLDAGPPPVAFGFSSSGGKHVGPVTRAVLEALDRCGQRGLLVAGLGGLKNVDLPSSVFRITSAPYAWLLPRVAALVHHGGAGSTAWGLRAGAPSVVVPFGYDQFLWGDRIHAVGAGPAPIAAEVVTADNMTEAIADVTGNPARRENARRVAAQMAGEHGVAAAVDLILNGAANERSE
jgi:UDP:flavonoid glycosyltransferase YjiC (YdhE family)